MSDSKLMRQGSVQWTFGPDELMSLVAEEEKIDEDKIPECFMAPHVVHHPIRTCCLCWLLIVVLTALLVVVEGTSFLFDFDQLAFDPIEKPWTQNLYSWFQVMEDVQEGITLPVKTVRWTSSWNIFVVPEGEQLLTVENVLKMQETEQLFEQGVFLNSVTDRDSYYSFCVAFPSLDERWPACSESLSRKSLVSQLLALKGSLGDDEWQEALDALDTEWANDESKLPFFNKEFANGGSMTTMRSYYNVGGPYPNVDSETSTYGNPMSEDPITGNATSQSNWYRNWYKGWYDELDVSTLEVQNLRTSNMEVFISSDIAWEDVENLILMEAFTFVGVAIVLVWILIATHTGSCFISFFGMGQIMMSIPISAFFYYFVCGFEFWSIFNMMTIFVVMGIGADDMFIFFDCWQQAEAKMKPIDKFESVSHYYIKRMSFTYRKAGKAMALTTTTTCVAFLSLMSSDLPAIKTFGVYSSFVIFFDFIFSLTVFPAGVMLAWKYNSLRYCGCCKWSICCSSCGDDKCPAKDPNKFGKVEMFFGTKCIRCISKLKIGVIIMFGILFGVAIWTCSQMQFPTEAEEIYKPGTNYARVFDYFFNFYDGGEVSITPEVRFVWGVNGLVRDSSDFVSASIDDGEPDYNPDFNIYDPQCQEFVLWVCDYVDGQTDYVAEGYSSCFMRDYKNWREANGSSFPAIFDQNDNTIQKSEFEEDLLKFVSQNATGGQLWVDNYIGFNWLSNELMFVSVSWKSTIDWTKGLMYNEKLSNKWNEIIAHANSQTTPLEIPESKIGMSTAEGGFRFTEMQRSLVNGFITSLGITFIAAFFALLIATANWVLSVIAVGSIAGIVCCVGMGAVSMGWDLGLIECLSGGVLIGFSVDYTVHLGVAYLHNAHLTTRRGRTRMALTELGVSITFGCITTICCGFPLYLTSVSYFYKFGLLVIMSVTLAILVALIFLPAVLLIIGPVNDSGSLPCIHDPKQCKCWGSKVAKEEIAGGVQLTKKVDLKV